ncbi:MAG: hypothetical protein JKX78_15410 [Alteromonadaceae bacterium]|nr:hypothetical protein [Alteromonadaceae bacterium]
MNYSLKKRLTSSLLISLIVAFMLIWLMINLSVRYLTYNYIYTRLSHDSETLLAQVIKNPDHFNKIAAGAVYQQPFSGHYFEIHYNKQIYRARSLWDQRLNFNLVDLQLTLPQRLKILGPMQQPLLLLVSQFKKDNNIITIAIAEDISTINTAITQFKQQFTLAVIIILFALISLQMWMLNKGLTPLLQLQKDLKKLENGQLKTLNTITPTELTPLKNSINQLHKALANRIIRHRNALSDLAHALKKPLTVLQQLAQDQQLDNLPEIKQTLLKQSHNTKQLTQRILNKARLAGSLKSHSYFDFTHDLDDLIATLKMMYSTKNLHIIKNIEPLSSTQFDREDMLELLGNILENACKWATSTVEIDINHTRAQINIGVSDDGKGIAEKQLTIIQQRGTRLDESIEGHGLGLGIVSDIIEFYQGKISYLPAIKLSGLYVKITLPIQLNE